MRFRAGLGLVCGVLLDLGCARPSLPEGTSSGADDADVAASQHDGTSPDDDDDDDTQAEDAGHDAGRRDAGQDAGRDAAKDAGAEEAGDDEEDAGASEDAGCTGDDCQTASCDGDTPADELTVSGAKVSGVRVDGQSGTSASVAPGASVRVQFDVDFGNCGVLPAPKQVYVGLESAMPQCQAGLCAPLTPSQSFDFTLNAPREPGLHYVAIGVQDGLLCGLTGSASTHLAALCVTSDANP